MESTVSSPCHPASCLVRSLLILSHLYILRHALQHQDNYRTHDGTEILGYLSSEILHFAADAVDWGKNHVAVRSIAPPQTTKYIRIPGQNDSNPPKCEHQCLWTEEGGANHDSEVDNDDTELDVGGHTGMDHCERADALRTIKYVSPIRCVFDRVGARQLRGTRQVEIDSEVNPGIDGLGVLAGSLALMLNQHLSDLAGDILATSLAERIVVVEDVESGGLAVTALVIGVDNGVVCG